MTDITPAVPAGLKLIQSYSNGRLRIENDLYETPVLVFPDRVAVWSGNILPEEFRNLSGLVDILIVGAGESPMPLFPVQRQAFRDIGLPVEVMETGAACRTYNVLAAEGRRVAAAIKPV
jgi:uncharacterized protein